MILRSSDFLRYMDFAPSNLSQIQSLSKCFNYTTVTHIMSSLCAVNILLISPLYFYILHLGCQHWMKLCFSSSSPTTRQSDLFTYSMVTMGLIEVLAYILYIAGVYTTVFEVAQHGLNITFVCWFVKLYFNTLTCIKHYMAVVHPVTYLGQKNRTGCSIKGILTVCVWLLLLFWGISINFMSNFFTLFICLAHTLLAFIVMFLCSFSVLWALKRPGPGKGSGKREYLDPSKKRAFCIISTVMTAVLLSLLWMLLSGAIFASELPHLKDKCLLTALIPWFSLPSNLVLPILHLQKAGKLPQCLQNSQQRVIHG